MRKETEKVILAGIDFSKNCEEMEEKYDISLELEECNLRFDNQCFILSALTCVSDTEEVVMWSDDAEVTVQELTDEEYMDGAIICEGTLYETLFYFEFGTYVHFQKTETEEIYSRLLNVLEKHGFQLDLSRPGTILLQTEESRKAQLERDFGTEEK